MAQIGIPHDQTTLLSVRAIPYYSLRAIAHGEITRKTIFLLTNTHLLLVSDHLLPLVTCPLDECLHLEIAEHKGVGRLGITIKGGKKFTFRFAKAEWETILSEVVPVVQAVIQKQLIPPLGIPDNLSEIQSHWHSQIIRFPSEVNRPTQTTVHPQRLGLWFATMGVVCLLAFIAPIVSGRMDNLYALQDFDALKQFPPRQQSAPTLAPPTTPPQDSSQQREAILREALKNNEQKLRSFEKAVVSLQGELTKIAQAKTGPAIDAAALGKLQDNLDKLVGQREAVLREALQRNENKLNDFENAVVLLQGELNRVNREKNQPTNDGLLKHTQQEMTNLGTAVQEINARLKTMSQEMTAKPDPGVKTQAELDKILAQRETVLRESLQRNENKMKDFEKAVVSLQSELTRVAQSKPQPAEEKTVLKTQQDLAGLGTAVQEINARLKTMSQEMTAKPDPGVKTQAELDKILAQRETVLRESLQRNENKMQDFEKAVVSLQSALAKGLESQATTADTKLLQNTQREIARLGSVVQELNGKLKETSSAAIPIPPPLAKEDVQQGQENQKQAQAREAILGQTLKTNHEELTHLKQTIASLNEQYAKTSEKNEQQRRDMEVALAQSRQQMTTLNQTIAALGQELKEATLQTRKQSTKTMEETTQRIEQWQQQLKSLHDESQKGGEQSLASNRQEVSLLKGAVSNISDELKSLSQEIRERVKKSPQPAVDARESLEQMAGLEKSLQTLRQDLDERDRNKLNTMRQLLDDSNQKITHLETTIGSLSTDMEKQLQRAEQAGSIRAAALPSPAPMKATIPAPAADNQTPNSANQTNSDASNRWFQSPTKAPATSQQWNQAGKENHLAVSAEWILEMVQLSAHHDLEQKAAVLNGCISEMASQNNRFNGAEEMAAYCMEKLSFPLKKKGGAKVTQGKWFDGGTLTNASRQDWQAAHAENRLATSASWVIREVRLTAETDLLQKAEQLSTCISTRTLEPTNLGRNTSDIAVECMGSLGFQLKSSALPPKDVPPKKRIRG